MLSAFRALLILTLAVALFVASPLAAQGRRGGGGSGEGGTLRNLAEIDLQPAFPNDLCCNAIIDGD